MQQKFFLQSFAFAGDTTAIPNPVQPSGIVSFNQGYGFDYQRELGVDPDAKSIERAQMNYLFSVITDNLGQYQRESIPEFITTADNEGAPYPYARGIMVRYRTGANPFLTYVSRTASNITTPTEGASTANWELLIFERSSNAQALAGTDNNTIMTPLRVAEAISASSISVPAASETVAGIAEIATTAEVNTGTDNTRIITPAKLAAYVPSATTAVIGKTRLATVAEAQAGSLTTVAVTPAGLAAAIGDVAVPAATESVAGIAEIATQAEVTTGTDNTRIVTPLSLATAVPVATFTIVGKSRFATQAETSAMAMGTVAVTPFSLASLMGTKANLSGAAFTGAVSAPQYTATNSAFIGSAALAILASSAAGSCHLRPNGAASATGQMTVASSGNMTVTGSVVASGGFQNGSSRFIKHDLRDLPYGLAAIEAIETSIGKYLPDFDPSQRDRLFVIAEQLAEVLPQAVTEDGLEHGGMRVPTVDYLQIIPVLIEAVKELAGRLRKLEG